MGECLNHCSFPLNYCSHELLCHCRELFELMSTAKQQRGDSVDSSQLIELLVHKDKELHATLQTGIL